jgi:hypothetical protein
MGFDARRPVENVTSSGGTMKKAVAAIVAGLFAVMTSSVVIASVGNGTDELQAAAKKDTPKKGAGKGVKK